MLSHCFQITETIIPATQCPIAGPQLDHLHHNCINPALTLSGTEVSILHNRYRYYTHLADEKAEVQRG